MSKFELYFPVKPKFINQVFGNVLPVYTGLGLKGHNGLDLLAHHGQPIYAAHDGVAYYEVDSNQGHGVVLRTNETYDYNGQQVYFKTIYWHMCDSAKEPQFKSPVEVAGTLQVKRGDLIGYADNTGLSTGDHLHFGLKPQAQGESNNSWYNVEQDNGYLGAIDPTPYFNGLFAQDGTSILFTRDFSYGETSEDVRQLQLKLGVSPTGYFGFLTLVALVGFKIKNGIRPITTTVDAATRNKLNL